MCKACLKLVETQARRDEWRDHVNRKESKQVFQEPPRAEIPIEISSLIVLSCLVMSSALHIESQVKDNNTAFNLKVDQVL
jgi:hypothetical protein